LEGIEVRIVETASKTLTDSDGHFTFENLNPGTYTIYPFYDGFQYAPEIVELKSGETKNITLLIGSMEYSLDEVKLQTLTISERLKTSAIKADVISIEENTKRANSVEELVDRSPGVHIRNVSGLGSTSNVIVGG